LKIAYLTGSLSRRAGGCFNSVRRLAQELVGTGLAVRVLGLRDADTDRDLALWDGVSVFAGHVLGPRTFGYCPAFQRMLADEQPELLHVHTLWMYSSVLCLRWSTGARKPYIVSPHGMLEPRALTYHHWKKRFAEWLYENSHLGHATCLHALREAEARTFRVYGLKNPICVIPNGIDVPTSLPGAPPAGSEDAGTCGAKALLYLGRLHPIKNLLNLLHAWAAVHRLSKAARDWCLLIAGWDQKGYHARLTRAVRELEIEGSVRFLGPQFGASKHATLRHADAFILPSLSEALPVAVLEAWAYGLPVLMTPQCNLPEGFAAGAAVQVDPEPASIAAGLRELLRMSDAERRAMGERGRRLVEERFSWPKIAQQMKAVYEWVLGGGAKPEWVLTA